MPRGTATPGAGERASPRGVFLSQAWCSFCTHLLLWKDLRGEVVFWALEAVKARAAFPWAAGLIRRGWVLQTMLCVCAEHKVCVLTGVKSE